MPTRLLREGILDSDRVNRLDWAAEVFYRRLMSKVDDYGLYDARISMLRTQLYPLKVDRVREADISRWLAECEKAGLILLYEAENKPYLQVLDTGWQERSKPKYPLPTGNGCKQLETAVYLVEDVVVVEDVDGKEKINKKEKFVLPEWIPEQLWLEWMDVRKRKRAVNNKRAMDALVTRLDEIRNDGYTVEYAISTAIEESWKGIKLEWLKNLEAKNNGRKSKLEQAADSINQFRPV